MCIEIITVALYISIRVIILLSRCCQPFSGQSIKSGTWCIFTKGWISCLYVNITEKRERRHFAGFDPPSHFSRYSLFLFYFSSPPPQLKAWAKRDGHLDWRVWEWVSDVVVYRSDRTLSFGSRIKGQPCNRTFAPLYLRGTDTKGVVYK